MFSIFKFDIRHKRATYKLKRLFKKKKKKKLEMKVFKEYRKVALVSKYYFVDKCRGNRYL